jgi:hypothetical protein
MRIRSIVGVIFCLLGLVWIAQGTNMMHGSGMSGHGGWTVIGVVALVLGLVILLQGRRLGGGRSG